MDYNPDPVFFCFLFLLLLELRARADQSPGPFFRHPTDLVHLVDLHVGRCWEPVRGMENRVEVRVQAPGALPPYAGVPAAPIRAIEQDRHGFAVEFGSGCGFDRVWHHGGRFNSTATGWR